MLKARTLGPRRSHRRTLLLKIKVGLPGLFYSNSLYNSPVHTWAKAGSSR